MIASQNTVVLVNPNLVVQRSDLFTTGIVYMPIGLASFAAVVREAGFSCQVVDAFGEAPNQCWRADGFLYRGLTFAQVTERINDGVLAVCLSAMNLTHHGSLVGLLRAIRQGRPRARLVVLENSQAVTAYNLHAVRRELFAAGADYILRGEPEERGLALFAAMAAGRPVAIPGVEGGGGPAGEEGSETSAAPLPKIGALDRLPFPAWEFFPLENYWRLGYAHGPLSSRRYLPLLTSRGCPYRCRFCVVPSTNDGAWRARSASDVVDEMEVALHRFGVTEFHVEDLNPTVSEERIKKLCHEILRRGLKVAFKFCAGTKIETIRSEETIELLARAGCRYLSMSPESGSARVLALMHKPFDAGHALRMLRAMNRAGIRSQACFVLGFPGETDEDRSETEAMVHQLVREGVDEIALFVASPVPGSAIAAEFAGQCDDCSALTFSPAWRQDYARLNAFRLGLYRKFLGWKLRYHFFSVLRQAANFLRRRFETKMEMVPFRALHTLLLDRGIIGTRLGGQLPPGGGEG